MKYLASALLAVSLAVTACGDDTSDALSEVCDQQEQVLEDLAALSALDPAVNTTGEYRSALEALEDSVDDLRDARAELVEQDVTNVENAFESLRSELEDLDDTVLADVEGEIGAAVDAQADELEALYVAAYESSSCSSDADADE